MRAIAIITIQGLYKKLAYTLGASIFFLCIILYSIATLTIDYNSDIIISMIHQYSEIVLGLFAIYYSALHITEEKKTKTLTLLRSKKRDAKAVILGKFIGLSSSVVIGYIVLTLLGYSISIILSYVGIIDYSTVQNEIFYAITSLAIHTSTILQLVTLTTISLTLSLFLNKFITMITTIIVYGISHSMSFLLYVYQYSTATSDKGGANRLIQVFSIIFPNFDGLVSRQNSNITHMATLTIILSLFLYNVIMLTIATAILDKKVIS